ncbi:MULTISPECIES: pantetheine-phosphate adenylyltransferase [Micrococcus]|uniref:pantetheine-phosphate adenylyltransferase n=1 Tax=Micrococcus TaxID=1269 RepID=UPI001CCC5A81|nr:MULTISPECIES: pantetheine-phosphate adenylyltransferase [Micrococcus]MCG7421603.1 pantetheine-phosphate adenylyltransferase [Micrococcus sp. ACRRV]UBH24168.1 pantetheine-phosphate adenylyltransferase [Micrococcus porci]
MRRAVCPGSFDPLHKGHLEVIARAASMFDEVVVAVSDNPAKRYRFSTDERLELIRASVQGLAGVSAEAMGPGLLAEFCREIGAGVIVKGLRNGTDLEFEAPMAAMNRHLTGVETVFLTADARYTHLSSSLIKEVHGLGGDVREFVPAVVHARLEATRP